MLVLGLTPPSCLDPATHPQQAEPASVRLVVSQVSLTLFSEALLCFCISKTKGESRAKPWLFVLFLCLLQARLPVQRVINQLCCRV